MVIIYEFYKAWRKNFTKIFSYRRVDVCPPNGDVDIGYIQTGSLQRPVAKAFAKDHENHNE